MPSYRGESYLSVGVVHRLPFSSPQPMPHTHELYGAMNNEVEAGPCQMQETVRRMTEEREKGAGDDASTSALNAGQRTGNRPRQYEKTHRSNWNCAKTLVSQEGASVLSWLRVTKNTFNALIRPFVVSRVAVNACK